MLDLETVILPVLMNNQIMRYGGTTELGVYGVVATVMSLFQALFGGVGQAIQPLVSANHGAGNAGRNRSFFRMGLLTVGVMGIAFCALGEFFPAALPPLAGIVDVWVALPLAEFVTAALAVALRTGHGERKKNAVRYDFPARR